MGDVYSIYKLGLFITLKFDFVVGAKQLVDILKRITFLPLNNTEHIDGLNRTSECPSLDAFHHGTFSRASHFLFVFEVANAEILLR